MENRDNQLEKNEKLNVAHLAILISDTVLSAVLAVVCVLLEWETWVIPLLIAAIIVCWTLHLLQIMPSQYRLWVYATIMMVTFFFYGIHDTSTFSMGIVAVVSILIFVMTGQLKLVHFATGTYYFTMLYHFVIALNRGLSIDRVVVLRVLLNLVLVFMANRIADVSIRKNDREKEEYDRKISQLEETNRRTEDFLTNVSHELRTPINAVTGITTLILNKVKNEDVREDVYSVQRAGHRLFEQIGDILDYTEIDTGRLVVSEEIYMISSLVNDMIAEYRMLMRGSELDLIFDVDAKSPAVLVGDGAKIKKILRHLIGNAVKFTKQGGVYIHIYTMKKPYGVNLCIEVSDTGIGMDTQEMSKIKERFYQVNSGRSRRAGGLGLGLSIVSGLTSAMDGFMQVDSEKDHGTTVRISIPQRVSDAAAGMTVETRDELCLANFQRPEKYAVPQLREFYSQTICHIVEGLELTLHNVMEKEDLEKLQQIYRLTHIFIGQSEYLEDPVYYESLENSIDVVIIAEPEFEPGTNSRAKILYKPLYTYTVASLLNVGSDGLEDYTDKQMRCDGIRVLVVDDEAMNLVVAEGIFGNYGMEVHTASGGPEALEICEKETFDIIFLDHMMPEMDGVEVMKRLRRMEQEIGRRFVIIALTANAVSGAREMFLTEGFDEFIAKPIEYVELERVLRKVLPKSAIRYISKKAVIDADSAQGQETDEKAPRTMTLLMEHGIDTTAGIRYCNNDKEFYVELLTKYAHDAAAKQKDIAKFYEDGDMKGYQIAVHALKSTSKMIGASALSDMAKSAEEAAKKNDKIYIDAHHEELLAKYDDVMRAINETFEQEAESTGGAEMVQIEEYELRQQLKQLKSCLDTFEADEAERLIGELSGYAFGERALKEALAEVKELVVDFDLSAAAEKTSAVVADLLGGDAL